MVMTMECLYQIPW